MDSQQRSRGIPEGISGEISKGILRSINGGTLKEIREESREKSLQVSGYP